MNAQSHSACLVGGSLYLISVLWVLLGATIMFCVESISLSFDVLIALGFQNIDHYLETLDFIERS
jgi:hypothetical protein